jgi:hypothetical protein
MPVFLQGYIECLLAFVDPHTRHHEEPPCGFKNELSLLTGTGVSVGCATLECNGRDPSERRNMDHVIEAIQRLHAHSTVLVKTA